MKTIRHTATADSDLQSILEWTLDMFGSPAVERYRRLVGRALRDVFWSALTHHGKAMGNQGNFPGVRTPPSRICPPNEEIPIRGTDSAHTFRLPSVLLMIHFRDV